MNSSSKAGGRPSPQITFLIQIVELNGIGLQVLSKAKLAKITTAEPSAAAYQGDNRLRELIFEQVRAGHGSVVVDTELTVSSGQQGDFNSQTDVNYSVSNPNSKEAPAFATLRSGTALTLRPTVLPGKKILTYQGRCFLSSGARTVIRAAIGHWQAKHFQYTDIPSKPDPCFRQSDQPRHQRAHRRQPSGADYLDYPEASERDVRL
ncbi:hypothetical protein [Gloeobacter morelensis]|uniref:Uncharacterized protein n=1 Tax=Gloeobacter morelensis MG652769 TaxID=2781736 RepID=A0ABY3PKT6_9CYAN|nr:hypothetical protein [Gloeobacter morelensis]UFP94158.1 hypothetical protein ISF26_20740 [Gloeobacter morelensis MG652769]